MQTAEDALLDFRPDDNQIDGILYDGIVEDNENMKRSSPRNHGI